MVVKRHKKIAVIVGVSVAIVGSLVAAVVLYHKNYK